MAYHACQWPVASQVKAFFSDRLGGASFAPFNELNLGDHVGDSPLAVNNNRQRLMDDLGLNTIPWLRQTHSQTVIKYDDWHKDSEADAIVACRQQQVCAVMTADCLPILLVNQQGTQVAAVHAGWRGLAAGIIANTLSHFHSKDTLYAYLCPAISQPAFEVGVDVYDAFTAQSPELAQAFTVGMGPEKYYADLYAIARHQLKAGGVKHIFGGDRCTFKEPEAFFSYRREGVTGRQVSLIWIDF